MNRGLRESLIHTIRSMERSGGDDEPSAVSGPAITVLMGFDIKGIYAILVI